MRARLLHGARRRARRAVAVGAAPTPRGLRPERRDRVHHRRGRAGLPRRRPAGADRDRLRAAWPSSGAFSAARSSTCAPAGRSPAGRPTTGRARSTRSSSSARRSAGSPRDLLWFCRLTDEDGKGTSGWIKHLRALSRRSERLTKLGLDAPRAARARHRARSVGSSPGTRWLGGLERTPRGRRA